MRRRMRGTISGGGYGDLAGAPPPCTKARSRARSVVETVGSALSVALNTSRVVGNIIFLLLRLSAFCASTDAEGCYLFCTFRDAFKPELTRV